MLSLVAQVLFGLFSVLDGVLPFVTPFYFTAKACILAWAASSARPYGGRSALRRAFEIINEKEDSSTNKASATKALLASMTESAAQMGIPPRVVRLFVTAAAAATGTVALGVCFWVASVVEDLFSSQPTWIQARVCVIAGASWPLRATLVARARADAARSGGENDGSSSREQRQGPAAVQWLSYWPIFAFFVAVMDPVAGWIPHYYSWKIVALVLLALPQTRGAYMITSLALYGNQGAFTTDLRQAPAAVQVKDSIASSTVPED